MHLKSDELVDLAEGTRTEASAPHLVTCDACRQQLMELRAVLSAAADVAIPEPSPLFWDHFSARVHDAVSSEPAPRRSWLDAWRGARWLVPMSVVAAAAAIVMTVAVNRSITSPPLPLAPSIQMASTTAIDPVGATGLELLNDIQMPSDDPSLMLVADLTSQMDVEAAGDAGLTARGSADHAVTHLNRGELRELQRLLTEELARSGN